MTIIFDPQDLSDQQTENIALLLQNKLIELYGTIEVDLVQEDAEIILFNIFKDKFNANYDKEQDMFIFENQKDLNWFLLQL